MFIYFVVLATFAVLPTKKVVNINNVTYKVRACAEKNSGGNKSGGSPGMGGGRSGKVYFFNDHLKNIAVVK